MILIKHRLPDISDTGSCQNNLGNPYFFNPYSSLLGQDSTCPFKFNECTLETDRDSGSPTLYVNDRGGSRFPLEGQSYANEFSFFYSKARLYGLHSTLVENSFILASYSQRYLLLFYQNRLRLLLILRVDISAYS